MKNLFRIIMVSVVCVIAFFGGKDITTGKKSTKTFTEETTVADVTSEEETTVADVALEDVTTVVDVTSEEMAKRDVWVVDDPAWTETITIYETKCRYVCKACGGHMYTQEELDNHPCAAGYDSENYTAVTGTEVVEHPEVGHWE